MSILRDNSKTSAFKRVIIKALVERDGEVCGLCGETLAVALSEYRAWATARPRLSLKARNKIDLSIDHLRPLSRGGGWELENLVLCHRQCNEFKKDMDMETFRLLRLYISPEARKVAAKSEGSRERRRQAIKDLFIN